VVDISNLSQSKVIDQIQAYSHADCILSVELTGLRSASEYLDLDAIGDVISGSCYAFHLVDRSTTRLDSLTTEQFPEMQVIGQFVRLLKAEIESTSDPDQRRLAEHALQLGVALLQGKEVLR
jgi:hypothetical protein